jgi:hypothetical protein
MKDQNASAIACAIAIVWPAGSGTPVCEMFRVDTERMEWTSKHYSHGASFSDRGRLRRGETARSLAECGTGSAVSLFAPRTSVTFVVADLDPARFDATAPTEWTLDALAGLPGARVARFGPRSGEHASAAWGLEHH